MRPFVATRQRRSGRDRRTAGLTLVEMMVAMSIFSMVTVALVYTHLFGLMQDELANSKLGASDQSRRGFGQLAEHVRCAKIWRIGNGGLSSFTPIANGTGQQGNALMINLTTATNTYILYFFDSSKGELRRRRSGVTGSEIIAKDLTGTMFFRAENHRGDLQTDLTHKGVVHVWLEFRQYQYPITKVGPGHYYDYYKMEFRLTSHVPDGP